jgi:hypothetical protein
MEIETRSFRMRTNPSPIIVHPAIHHAQVQEEEPLPLKYAGTRPGELENERTEIRVATPAICPATLQCGGGGAAEVSHSGTNQ